jgi:hypothetical protein
MELRSSICKKDKIKSGKLTRKCKEHSNHGNMHERRKTLENLWQILSQIIILVELASMGQVAAKKIKQRVEGRLEKMQRTFKP